MVEHWEDCECRKCDRKRIEDLRAENERLREVSLLHMQNGSDLSQQVEKIERERDELREAMKQILDCEDCPEKIAREAMRQEGGAE